MKKNVAGQVIGAQMVSATDGSAFTGTATVVVTVDGGTQSASGGTGPAHEGNGLHTYLPTQAETNGAHVAFTFTGSGAVPVTVQVYPQVVAGNGYPQTDVYSLGNTTQTARDIGASVLLSSGTGTGQIQLSGGNVTQVTNVGNATLAGITHTSAVIPTVTTLTGHTAQTGDSFARIGAPAGASVSADIAAVKSDTAAVLVDTGTTLDGKVDGIKAKTDSLTFTTAGQVDSNVQSVNDVEITGNGTIGNEWGP